MDEIAQGDLLHAYIRRKRFEAKILVAEIAQLFAAEKPDGIRVGALAQMGFGVHGS